jgi:signal transduction histidine kinase
VGLGLALSREIARAHGGELTLAAGADGVVEFSLRLPRRH